MDGLPPTRRRPPLAILAACVAVSLCTAGPDLGTVTVEDFTFKEFARDGQPVWIIFGATAVAARARVKLRGVQMIYRGDGNEMRVFSPECEFDRQTRTGSSSKRVQLRSQAMLMEGEGFHLDLAARRLSIKSKARVRIFEPDANLLGEPAR